MFNYQYVEPTPEEDDEYWFDDLNEPLNEPLMEVLEEEPASTEVGDET